MIFGENPILLRSFEQYAELIPEFREKYELLAVCDYNNPVAAETYLAADIVIFSLYRRYGLSFRAEGIPALEKRLLRKKRGLLYDFSNYHLESNPLVWWVPGKIPLHEKLDKLSGATEEIHSLYKLQQMFQEDIFVVDGHAE